MIQQTLVIIKPDAVARGLVGKIIARYEVKGLKIVSMEYRSIDAYFAKQHYVEHLGRPYYDQLIGFMTSGPLVGLVVEGPEAIQVVRSINGATNGTIATPGTIRGDWAISNRENLVHGSDSLESAARELALWFPELEINECMCRRSEPETN